MLQITPQARRELHGMLTRHLDQTPEPDAGNLGFRLVAATNAEEGGTRLRLALDTAREEDEIVEHDGRSVLMFGPSVSALVGDLTLDLVETPDGSHLQFRE